MTDRRSHIKLSRRLFEDETLWLEPRRFSRAEAWIDLIQWAAHEPRRYVRGAHVEELDRGQFIASIRYLAKRWAWPKTVVSDFLMALQTAGRIAGQRDGHWGTVYMLVNYSYYQGTGDTNPDSNPDTGIVFPIAKPGKQQSSQHKSSRTVPWLNPYAVAWASRCGTPNYKRLAKSLAPLRDELGDTEAVARWQRYLQSTDPKFASPERFVATHRLYERPATEMRTDGFGHMVPHQQTADGTWEPVTT